MYANERKMKKCEYFGPDLTREEGNEFGSHAAGRTCACSILQFAVWFWHSSSRGNLLHACKVDLHPVRGDETKMRRVDV